MRAISKAPVPYVPVCERGNEPDKQTVFWIKPKTYEEVNRAMKRYGGAVKDSSDGYKAYDDNKLNSADQEEWKAVVTKIENFEFPSDFVDENKTRIAPDNMEKSGKYDGTQYYRIKVIEDEFLKVSVLRNLDVSVVNEIWKACQDRAFLSEGLKNA